MKTLFILIALLALTVGSSLVVTQKMRQQKAQPNVAVQHAQSPAVEMGAQVSGSAASKMLDIAIAPAGQQTDLSAFTIEATVNGLDATSVNTLTKPVPATELTQGEWSFPILSVTKQSDSSALLKVSAVHVSTQPFILNGRHVVVSLPLSSRVAPTSISLTLDPTHTKLYRKDGTEAPLSDNTVTVSVAEEAR